MHDHSPQIEEHGINPYHPSSVLGICTATYQLRLVMSAPHRFPDVKETRDAPLETRFENDVDVLQDTLMHWNDA